MGRIVGATWCTHVPRLMIPPEKRAAYMGKKISTFYEALSSMYKEHMNARVFDTFLIFDTHWYSTLDFLINGHTQHRGIYTSDEIPQMINNYEYNYPGDSELADLIKDEGAASGLPVYVARENHLPYHYPTLNTMYYLNPFRIRRVLPMSITYNSSIENELIYGEAIRRAVERSNRNVVLVATGGLSHHFWELDVIRQRASADPSDIYSEKHRAYDMLIIDLLQKGRHGDIIVMAEHLRKEISPEGRLAHYLRMVGALGGVHCFIPGIQYGEYEAAAGTGQANFWFEAPGGKGLPLRPLDNMIETAQNPIGKDAQAFLEDLSQGMYFPNMERKKGRLLIPVSHTDYKEEE